MRAQPLVDEHDIVTLLAGEDTSGAGDLTELGRFLQQVRHAAAGPSPRVSPRLEAVLAHGLSDGPAPGVTARSTRATRRVMARAAAVAGVLSLAATGAAAADLLPRSAQDGVASLVESITPLDLPDSADATDRPRPAPDRSTGHEEPRSRQGEVSPEVEYPTNNGTESVGTGDRSQGGVGGTVTKNVPGPPETEKERGPTRPGNGGATIQPHAPTEPGPPRRGHIPEPTARSPEQSRAGDNPGMQRRP